MPFPHDIFLKYKNFIGPLVITIATAFMVKLSWFKWPDILVDYGTELYVPWQITQGKILYSDIGHGFGPLADYLNALLFLIFGTGLSTLVYFNILLVIILTIIIYNLFESTFNSFTATICTLCFTIFFAFSQYTGIANYNYICPYAYEITYGIFLFFLSLFMMKKYIHNPTNQTLIVIGFLFGLIYLTKVEVFVASSVSIISGLILIHTLCRVKFSLKQFFLFVISFLFPVLLFFFYLLKHMSLDNALDSIFISYTSLLMAPVVKNIFYMRISGFDDIKGNLFLMFKYTSGYFIVIVLAALSSFYYTRITNPRFRSFFIVFVFSLTFGIIINRVVDVRWIEVARPYPIILLLVLLYYFSSIYTNRNNDTHIKKYIPFLMLTLFALVLLLKMILNVHIFHYGFALAMPATLVTLSVLVFLLPSKKSFFLNQPVAVGYVVMFIFLAGFFYFNITLNVYQNKTYAIGKGEDKFYTFSPHLTNRGPIVNKVLYYIEKDIMQSESFVVIPEGLMLNYLARRENKTPYSNFIPNFYQMLGDDKIIAAMQRAKPDFIIFADKDTSEQGAEYFGKDYAIKFNSWIYNNYSEQINIGARPFEGRGFGISVMKAN